MKKILVSILLCVSVLILSFNIVTAKSQVVEKPNIKIDINGKIIKFPAVLITLNGQPLLPFRELLVNLGVKNDKKHIVWNDKDGSIKVNKDGIAIYFKIGDVNASVNDVKTTMEVATIIYKGKTYLPVRFVAQSFGKKVNWDGKSNTLSIVNQTTSDKIKYIIEKADLVLKKSKYKVEMQQSASDNSGLSFEFNTNEKQQTDNINKISYVNTKYIDTEGIENVCEMLVCNKTFYAKFSFSNGWGKLALTDERFNWYLYTWGCKLLNTYLVGAKFGELSLDENTQQGKIVIQGKIKNYEDHKELGERETIIKIIVNKNTYQYQEVFVEAKQIADKSKNIEEHFTYSEYNGDFNVYIPEDLPK